MTKIQYGNIHTLREPIKDCESWNLSTGKKFTLEKGQQVKVLRVYDTYHTTIQLLDTKGEKSIHHPDDKSAYRFIVNNIVLSDAIDRYIPTTTPDPIGELLNI